MKLYGTYPSHFTRKVRVVLMELGVPFEFSPLPVEKMLATDAATFGQNPLLKVPVLETEGRKLFESDLICEYLVENHGRNASFTYLPKEGDRTQDLQRLAIVDGAMTAGADLLMGARSQIPDLESFVIFRQRREMLQNSLAWLEKDLGARTSYGPGLSLLEVTLQCLLDWGVFRKMIPPLEAYPNLAAFRAHWGKHPSFAKTHPEIQG